MTQPAGETFTAGVVPNPRAEALWLIPCAAIVLLTWTAAAIGAELSGISALPLAYGYALDAARGLLVAAAVLLCVELARAAWRREATPARQLLQAALHRVRSPWLIAGALGPLVLLPVMLGAFGTLKVLLPLYLPFAHDELFARMDQALFLGQDPWRITHMMLPDATTTVALDGLYTAWLPILPLAIGGFALLAPRADRARFMLTMILVWALLGVAGAWAGSSAGPIFLDLLSHPEAPRYAGLMQNLAAADAAAGPQGLTALHWRMVLWNAYASSDLSFSMGISAMPSMHNAITMLYVLAAFRLNKWLGFAASLYAVVIFVGSIHLAWHYAVDGLASMIAVTLIWMAVGRYLSRSGYDALVTGAAGEEARAGAPDGAQAARGAA